MKTAQYNHLTQNNHLQAAPASEAFVETHDRILKSALVIFSEKGYALATIKDISKKAGCNNVTIFRHFGDKKTLFDETVRRYKDFQLNTDELESKLSYMSLHNDFRMMSEYFFAAVYDNIHILRIFMNDGHSFESLHPYVWFVPEQMKEFVSGYLLSMYPDKISQSDVQALTELFLCYILRTCLRMNVHEGIEENTRKISADARETIAPSINMIVDLVMMSIGG